MDMRWRVTWRDVDVLKVKGSMTSGFGKSKISLNQEVDLYAFLFLHLHFNKKCFLFLSTPANSFVKKPQT